MHENRVILSATRNEREEQKSASKEHRKYA